MLEFILAGRLFYNLYLFIKRAFETTLTEENAIAAATIAGFKRPPSKRI